MILKRIMLPFQHEKHEKLKDIHNLLSVGVPRFERGTPCSQSRCANRTALHPETFKRHKGTHYISICNPIAPRKPFGGGDTRERSDPGGIQTHDLQNRNLTLYSAKLPSLIASLCSAKVHFSSQPLDIFPSKERRCTYNWKIHVLLSCPSLLRWLLLVV